ncbi:MULTISPECIES: response regulator transcription factor [Streptomyces]|uniref:DNA-binding response regulator n=1 Tax=Streptomyces tsukubensis (strain DSM 42081 / NBRC 108919 / NRRL 18488 / 9993) TaxID=1114943 RepID=I2NBK1_STRT9|nr:MULTISPECIES: response regulator transcription factor [Streptomyces]AZK98109.1 DNA-binding response regulator [Streptomyces tsukubensis]EIF94398.1 transcriptional regulator [Streptomyces tsukubensis NRRL18488]MYS63376.1 DNA-binding response regulator [Streptomyces sp. SID5473]QKM65968.1 DNA-binding response regulator [Streptomyces tsukubensis NRRL18488]TAI42253.1 response regulator transcription factor [Streptomyces tsukubensis]
MTTVLLVHAVSLWRASLACLLSKDENLDVHATDKGGVRTAVQECPPDVIVTDLECPHSMEVLTFMESLRGAEESGPGLVVLARADRAGDLRRAGDAGAMGYVDKLGPVDSLGDAVGKVAAGGRHIDESLAFGLLNASEVPLSPRELRVLELAAEGESVTSIASALHLASGTVRNYLAAAIRKTGGRNRLDAIRLSRDFGWL